MNSVQSKPYSQKIEAWLLEKSGCHLIDFCHRFGYYPLAVKIMALDETDEKKSKAIMAKDLELRNHYLKCAKDSYTIKRKGENRSFTQYFKDLITGWVVEDLVMEMLKEQGIEIQHNGHDAARKIAIGNDVSQEADFSVKVGKVVRKVEITNEFNTLLAEKGYIEKRAPALVNLWKNRGIWLYRDLINGTYILIDFATEKVKLHLRRHNTGRANWAKDVHRYLLEENGKKVRSDRLLAAELISVVGCTVDSKEQPKLEEVLDLDSPPQDYDIGGKSRSAESNAATPAKPKIVSAKTAPAQSVKPMPQKPKPIAAKKPPAPPPPPPIVVEDDYDDGSDFDAEDWNGVDLGDGDFV